MINHIQLIVNDLEISKEFFTAALTPLGYKLCIEKPTVVGFGQEDKEGKRDFWIRKGEVVDPKSFSCLAFTASSKQEVEAFYKAALQAGAKSNYSPRYWPKYHSGYYAAFICDPNGYNVEAVYDDVAKR